MTREKEQSRAGINASRRDFFKQIGGLGLGLAATATQTSSAAADQTAAAQVPSALNGSAPAAVHVNQVGYLPDEPKRAVIAAAGPMHGMSFCLVDDDVLPRIRYRGLLAPYTPSQGETARGVHHYYADFDDFNQAGRYRVRLADGRMSPPFSIRRNLYNGLIPLTLEFFQTQACGTECRDRHDLCHTDDGVALGGPRNGQPMDGSGGWHDAGDYMKFVETTSYVAALMLFTYDRFRPAFSHRFASKRTPDLLVQARVGLEWLLKMHPAPDEFYYQVGDATDHDHWRLPERDSPQHNARWQPRPMHFGIGANQCGRAAAALALASRLYPAYDHSFAHRCQVAAKSIYALGLQNPKVCTTEPRDFYPESTWEDDMAWGGAELFRATGDPSYLNQALAFAHRAKAAGEQTSVYNTHALAHATLYPIAPEHRDRLRTYLQEDAELACQRAGNAYGLATPLVWGTSEAAAGAALNCLLFAAVDEGDNRRYLDVARRNRDYILGCNPFGTSHLVGAGTRYPLFPHHPIANLRQIELTGALVGGPAEAAVFQSQKIRLDVTDTEMIAGPPVPPDLPDRTEVYHDAVQDYVTNEPAIDYTAKFLLLAGFYQSTP